MLRPEAKRRKSVDIPDLASAIRTKVFSSFGSGECNMINQAKTRIVRGADLGIPVSVVGRILLIAAVVCLCAVGKSEAKEDANVAALAQIRGLAGEWEGSFEWSGARTATGKIKATYYEKGNGSAVVENLEVNGVPAMTSVYHLDGADVAMTHYCAAQNQPRLKTSHIDVASGNLDFEFVDATNLGSPDAPHVYGVEMRLLNADHITLAFLFEGNGKRSKEFIDLKRVGHKPTSQ
jgi:hypothetical protein